jgi:hypothetical protein
MADGKWQMANGNERMTKDEGRNRNAEHVAAVRMTEYGIRNTHYATRIGSKP